MRDGNVITGGGVTAGIDFGLVVAAELSGEAFAQTVQLNIEYAPAPPFELGSAGDRDTRGVGNVAGALRETSARTAGGRARGGRETVRGIVGVSPQFSLRHRAWRAPASSNGRADFNTKQS